jgi:hypothetical protein
MKPPKNLPNKLTSDQQLRDWCQTNVENFVDVIDRTQFEKYYPRMSPGQSLIINLDPKYKHGGTHWVALRISSEAPLVYYKDSFGAPCPAEIIDTIKKYGHRGLIYGNRINQKIQEENCGKLASYFLRDMANCAKQYNEIECFEQFEN